MMYVRLLTEMIEENIASALIRKKTAFDLLIELFGEENHVRRPLQLTGPEALFEEVGQGTN